MANGTKRALANVTVSDSLSYSSASHVLLSVTQFILCKHFQKFMHLPDSSDPPVGHSGSVAENNNKNT